MLNTMLVSSTLRSDGCTLLISDTSRLIVQALSVSVVAARSSLFFLLGDSLFVGEGLLPPVASLRGSRAISIILRTNVVIHDLLENEGATHYHGDLTEKSASSRASVTCRGRWRLCFLSLRCSRLSWNRGSFPCLLCSGSFFNFDVAALSCSLVLC